VASDNGVVIAAGWWGKVKTVVQMIMVIVLICDFGGKAAVVIENILIYAALALTVISLIDYLAKNKDVISDFK
jgi:CDP-diacylglycerol--glycerol-3-phosphate 3-phosphatidyltransferase